MRLLCLLTLVVNLAAASQDGCEPKLTAEKRFVKATIAVKALVTQKYKESILEAWILDVYKGEDKLAAGLGLPGHGADAVFHLKDQRVNVSHSQEEEHKKCQDAIVTQKTYVLLLQPSYDKALEKSHNIHFKARNEDPFIDFTLEMERKLLKAQGWSTWSDWSPCSQSCDGGQQERHRQCHLSVGNSQACGSFNAEKRTCNSFACSGAVNTLSVREERYFKPSPSAFVKVAERGPDAWQIKPGSYILLPFKDAFGRQIPRDFTIFITIKPAEESEGILFSLNARNSRQEYISLELNEGRLELVHSLPNGSRIIDIPAKINDGHWHQLAISIHGGSSVRTYLDCHWITTQVLHIPSLVVPKDTDLIIGYMYQGDLEQLTIVDETFGGVSEQCSPNKVPFQHHPAAEEAEEKKSNNNDFHIEESPQKTFATSFKEKEVQPAAKESVAVVSSDYLEEEYVDLDWDEDDYSSNERPVSKVSKRTQTPLEPIGSITATSSEDEEEIADETDDGSGHQIDDEDLEEGTSKNGVSWADAWISEGSGQKALGDFEWSAWSPCSKSCGNAGWQKRTASCMSESLTEECPTRHESRPCNRRPCPATLANSGWIPVRYETVTKTDIDHVRNHIMNGVASAITKRPDHHSEEHTNVIPHIPNYWTPSESGIPSPHESKPEECWCTNGGTCEYHNHIYGHHHPLGKESATCKCRKGYVGKHCEVAVCRPGCANGGVCVDPDVCSCPDGYTGARCQTAFCHPGCQNGGSCVAPFKCECPLGVTGAFCQEFSCQPRCANGGVCIGHNLCSCPHGFSGPDCQDKTCTLHCENGGVCTMPDNTCKCRDGFYGARCHKKLCQRYIAVREPHRRAYKQVVNVEYDTICSDGQSCKKTRPGYKTMFRTVYRTAYKCASDLD